MDMRQMEIFAAIMEHGTFSHAARALGITQPAVSTAVARLERQVGFALFLRDGRHVVPTTEAGLLLSEATRTLAGIAQLDEAVAGILAAQRGHLTIASNPGPGIAWLPRIVAGFRAGRPDVTVRFLTRSSREVRALVAARAFDLGIAEPPFDRGDAVVHRYRFACVAVLPAGHPLAAMEAITPALLDGHDVIAMLPSHGTSPAVAQAFEAAGSTLRIVAECEFFATALNLVRHGAGVTLSDPISAAETAGPGLVVRPFRPVIPYDVAVLRPARGGLSLLASEFASMLDRRLAPFLEPS
ncbi:MAG: LysR family transcriptional regulator [Gemmatimonadaceae bacterium]|nr:LysR family transcriptional regulator [Acetobacteraceae bacterium]